MSILSFLLIGLAQLPAVQPSVPAPASAPANGGTCQRQLAFSDDFHRLAISPYGPLGKPSDKRGARWIAHTPWSGDFGAAAFADPGPNGPFTLSAEGLRITASRDDTGHWHSGLIAGADVTGLGAVPGGGVRYGYFEARMKLPPGPGTWPAFWLMSQAPAHDAAPAVEIDVIEYYGHATAEYRSALHVWYHGKDRDRSRHAGHANPVPDGALVGHWHDYGLAVGPSRIIWYLDHAEVWRQPTPPELNGPLYPLVNLALGSGYPVRETPNPSVLDLASVRIWRDPPGGCAAMPEPPSHG